MPHPAEMAADDRRRARRISRPAPGARVPAASHSRTRDLFEDFVKVLSTAMRWCSPTSTRRASRRSRRERQLLARGGARRGQDDPVFVEDIGRMAEGIRRVARDGDVVLTMGAGRSATWRRNSHDDRDDPVPGPARRTAARRAMRGTRAGRPVARDRFSRPADSRPVEVPGQLPPEERSGSSGWLQPAGARRRVARHGDPDYAATKRPRRKKGCCMRGGRPAAGRALRGRQQARSAE